MLIARFFYFHIVAELGKAVEGSRVLKIWYIPKGKVKGTELEKHIILDAEMKKSCK